MEPNLENNLTIPEDMIYACDRIQRAYEELLKEASLIIRERRIMERRKKWKKNFNRIQKVWK